MAPMIKKISAQTNGKTRKSCQEPTKSIAQIEKQDLDEIQSNQNYEIKSKLFKLETIKQHENFQIKRNKNSLYFGCLVEN